MGSVWPIGATMGGLNLRNRKPGAPWCCSLLPPPGALQEAFDELVLARRGRCGVHKRLGASRIGKFRREAEEGAEQVGLWGSGAGEAVQEGWPCGEQGSPGLSRASCASEALGKAQGPPFNTTRCQEPQGLGQDQASFEPLSFLLVDLERRVWKLLSDFLFFLSQNIPKVLNQNIGILTVYISTYSSNLHIILHFIVILKYCLCFFCVQ